MTDELQNELLITFGGAVKALGDGKIGGHLVLYGSPAEKDLTGEYFSAHTDFVIEDYPVKGERVLYHHGLDPKLAVKRLSQFEDAGFDDEGLWVRAQLDLSDRYQKLIYQLVERGKLGWSSGALPQSVRKSGDGHILKWAIIEGSLTPTPADPRNRAVIPMKTYLESVKGLLELDEPQAEEAAVGEAQADTVDGSVEVEAVPEPSAMKTATEAPIQEENNEMDAIKRERLVSAAVTAVASALNIKMTDAECADAVTKAADEFEKMWQDDQDESEQMKAFAPVVAGIVKGAVAVDQDAINASVKAGLAAVKPVPQSQVGGYSKPQPRITVASKYQHLTPEDMGYMASVLKAFNGKTGNFWMPTEPFMRELADKAQKAVDAGAMKLSHDAMKTLGAIKANELDHSTQSGYGDEFVNEAWSSALWRTSRLDNVVSNNTNFIDMPSDPYKLPLQGSDPTVYAVPETTAESELLLSGAGSVIPDSKIGTNNTTMNAAKLALRVGFSTELTEDSIIPIIPLFREQSLRAMQDARDNVLLNADDTNSNSNINTDGSPSAGDKFLYGGGDGFLHLPLVDNTSQQLVSLAGGSLTLAKIREARFKLRAADAMDIPNLVMYVDVSTYSKMLAIDEISAYMNRGSAPTVESGEVGRIDNIAVFVSNEMSLAKIGGTVSATTGNNVYGRLLFVHKPSWMAGYRRQVNLNVTYLPYYDSYQLSATMRMALVRKNTRCASAIVGIAV